MKDKKMTLEIEGKNVVLNYESNWFFEHFKEDSGHDLISNPLIDSDELKSVKVFDVVQSFVWAGYRCECSMRKKEPELTREDIKHFVMSMNTEEAGELGWKISACRIGTTVEELKNAATQAESNGALTKVPY